MLHTKNNKRCVLRPIEIWNRINMFGMFCCSDKGFKNTWSKKSTTKRVRYFFFSSLVAFSLARFGMLPILCFHVFEGENQNSMTCYQFRNESHVTISRNTSSLYVLQSTEQGQTRHRVESAVVLVRSEGQSKKLLVPGTGYRVFDVIQRCRSAFIYFVSEVQFAQYIYIYIYIVYV